MAWHYNFKVIPTEFRKLDGTQTATNQFSVTRHEKALSQMSSRLPGINFHFEIAPIAVIKVQLQFFFYKIKGIAGDNSCFLSVFFTRGVRARQTCVKT